MLEADSRLHCIGSGGEANKRCARRGDARLGPGRRRSLLLVPLNDRLERAETRPVKVDVAQRRVRQHAQQHVAHALLARRAAAPEVAEKVGDRRGADPVWVISGSLGYPNPSRLHLLEHGLQVRAQRLSSPLS